MKTILSLMIVLSLPLAATAQELKQNTPAAATVRLKLPTTERVAVLTARPPALNSWSSPPTIQKRHRSVGRKILGGSLGAVGGLFAGGFIGAKVEGDSCECDDPGLMGALIGAPIGAVVGGVLGAIFF